MARGPLYAVLLLIIAALAAGRALPNDAVRISTMNAAALPVVLWHGMGDSADASYSMGAIKKLIEEELGVFVYSVATGDTAVSDVWSSFFGNVNDQIAKVCAQLRDVPELAGGFNAVGFSQGGQFLRTLVQRCQHTGPLANILVTLGAQHQGVSNIPSCSTVPSNLTAPDADQNGASACETMQTLLGRGAYLPWVRDHVVQAQYFKDPARMDEYIRFNPFLPDANNEKADKNTQYAENLGSLAQLVLYRFTEDATVVPRDSSWFAFDDGKAVVPLREQPLYKEDWLGLRKLDEEGRLHFLDAPGQHMQFTAEWFKTEVIHGLLAAAASDDSGSGSDWASV